MRRFAENEEVNKWNYFSYYLTSDQKTCFTKCFLLLQMSSKLVLKTGKGIIQTGNGINSPTSWAPLKKNVSYKIFLTLTSLKLALKTGKGIIQTGNRIIFLLPELQSKNLFYKMFLTFTNESTSLAGSATLDDTSWARLTFHLRVSCQILKLELGHRI